MANLVGGSIVWNLDVDAKKFDSAMDSARSKAKQLSDDVNNSATTSFNGLSKALDGAKDASYGFATGLAVVATGLGAAVGFGVKYAANLETMRAGFITLLGSADKADAAILQIQKDAASTPFNFAGLVAANQQLTSVTKNADRSEKFLLNVGKALTAMGKGQPELDRIIVNLQQIGAVGRASSIDLKQFAFAGIPIYDLLNDKIKGTGKNLEDMISGGEITFEVLENLFNEAGTGAGRFSRAFTDMGGTFNQLWSNMQDNLGIVASQVVTSTGIFDGLKDALNRVVEALQYFATPEGTARIVAMFNFIRDNGPIIAGIILGGLTPALYALAGGFLAALAALAPFLIAGAAIGFVIKILNDRFDLLGKGLPILIGLIATAGVIIGSILIPLFTAWAAAAIPAAIATIAATWPLILLAVAIGAVVAAIAYLVINWGTIWPRVVSVFTGAINAVKGALAALPAVMSAIWLNITTIVNTAITSLIGFVMSLPAAIAGAILQMITNFAFLLAFVIGLFVYGIPAALQATVNFFVALPSLIWNTLVSLTNTITTGWTNIWNWIKTTVPQIIASVVGYFATLPQRLAEWLVTTKTSVSNGFVDIWNAIVAEVSTWPGKLYDWGVNIATAFVDGIKKAIGKIVDAFKDGLNAAKKMVEGKSPPIAGPFKNIDKWGFNVGNAWVEGMRGAISAFSLPASGYAYSPVTMGSGIGEVGSQNNSITHSPTIEINLGTFIGTEAEKRKFAYDMQVALDQYYKGRGR